MKIITTILIPYIFLLGIMPCSDVIVNDDHSDETIELISSGHHDHNHSDCTDLCSPFCMCQCCSTPSTLSNNFTNFLVIEFYDSSQFFYKEHQSFGFVDEIFQPPKFV